MELIKGKGAYDVYLVDWRMPGIDGIALSRKIREAVAGDESVKPVIIMISAGDWNVIEDEAKAAGIDSFLSKPLFPSGIADCISRYLGAAGQTVMPEKAAVPAERFEGKKRFSCQYES
jgi:CheY-like chemotaxis protein